MAPGELQFAAFLSYSRQDKQVALWLVRALEELRLPREAVGELETRQSHFSAVRPVFRDESDMPVGGAVPARLAEVLDASAALIVLCTPASAQSAWVNEEIARFAERHPGRPIIPAVAEGDPDSSASYPPALLKLGKPLAADLRAPGDRWQAVVKIAAAVLGLDVDRLVGRIAKRRAERQKWIVAGAGATGAAFAWLAFTAWQLSDRAGEATDRALATVEVALTDAREQVSAAGTLATRAAVLAVPEAYFDGKKPGELTDRELQLKAKMLVQKGQDAAERGENDEALKLRQAAFAATEELLSRKPDDPDRLFDHGQSAFWVGDFHWRKSELDDARRYFEIYRAAAQRVLEVKDDYPNAELELAYANSNLGVLRIEQLRDPRGGAALFAETVSVIAPIAADTETKRNLNLAYRHQILAVAQYDSAANVLVLTPGWADVLGELEKLRTRNHALAFYVAQDLYVLGELEKRAGRLADGQARQMRAVAIADDELKADPYNREWLALATQFDLKKASSGVECSKFEFETSVEGYRAVACLRSGNSDARKICAAFADWLPTQKPNFETEKIWAAILARCSHDSAVSGDKPLNESLDQVAAARFFVRDPHGFSLWTQIELAGFKSAGRNTARVRELREDLQRRGWNGSQS